MKLIVRFYDWKPKLKNVQTVAVSDTTKMSKGQKDSIQKRKKF